MAVSPALKFEEREAVLALLVNRFDETPPAALLSGLS
jgi:hypothetical protein